MLFSHVAAPIHTTTSRARGIPFLHNLTNTPCLFEDRHSNRGEVVSHCGFAFPWQRVMPSDTFSRYLGIFVFESSLLYSSCPTSTLLNTVYFLISRTSHMRSLKPKISFLVCLAYRPSYFKTQILPLWAKWTSNPHCSCRGPCAQLPLWLLLLIVCIVVFLCFVLFCQAIY